MGSRFQVSLRCQSVSWRDRIDPAISGVFQRNLSFVFTGVGSSRREFSASPVEMPEPEMPVSPAVQKANKAVAAAVTDCEVIAAELAAMVGTATRVDMPKLLGDMGLDEVKCGIAPQVSVWQVLWSDSATAPKEDPPRESKEALHDG